MTGSAPVPARPRRRWRMLIGLIGVGAAAAALVLVQPLWVFDVLQWLFPRVVWRVDTAQPVVALTFDDGPSPDHTPRVLAALAKHEARATFFLIGERAAAHPHLVDAILQAGHEIGNHSYTDRSNRGATDEQFLARLLRTEEALGLGGAPKLYRPPGGFIRGSQLDVAEEHGYLCILGSAYPYDPSLPPSGYIRWLVSKNLAPGVIVILHDGIAEPSRSVAALDGILSAGERRGLRFVTVSEALAAARR